MPDNPLLAQVAKYRARLDKQNAAEARGYDWEKVQERMLAEKTASGNVGAELLNQFLKTGK